MHRALVPEQDADHPESDDYRRGQTWASSVESKLATSLDTQERRRQEAIFELIQSERLYLGRLQMVVQCYVEPLHRILPARDLQVLFLNIEDLLMCDTALYSDLESRQTAMGLFIDGVGDIIVKHARNFETYSKYCSNQRAASVLLVQLRKQEPAINRILTDIQAKTTLPNMDLASFLLEPMQRITRLPLLVGQIKKYSAENDAVTNSQEVDDLGAGLAIFEEILRATNDNARRAENRERLLAISQSLALETIGIHLDLNTSRPGTSEDERQYIMEDTLIKAKSGRRLRAYLLSDLLLLAEEEADAMTGKRSIYRTPFVIRYTAIVDLSPSAQASTGHSKDELSFEIIHTDGCDSDLKVRAQNMSAKRKWIREVQNAIAKTHV